MIYEIFTIPITIVYISSSSSSAMNTTQGSETPDPRKTCLVRGKGRGYTPHVPNPKVKIGFGRYPFQCALPTCAFCNGSDPQPFAELHTTEQCPRHPASGTSRVPTFDGSAPRDPMAKYEAQCFWCHKTAHHINTEPHKTEKCVHVKIMGRKHVCTQTGNLMRFSPRWGFNVDTTTGDWKLECHACKQLVDL